MSCFVDCNMFFIFNEWYVVVFSDEVGCLLFKCMLLGKCLVLFCIGEGKFVVMDDCCVYCFYFLLVGQFDGDIVVCGYYGLCYDQNGDCIEVLVVVKCFKNIGV